MTDPSARSPLLVLADDGSEPSDIAWRWITRHRWPEWRVEVLTADETQVVWGEPAELAEWEPSWDRSETIEAAELSFLTAGEDARALLAEKEDADLLVVGLRTHSYLAALVTGSTTEWLLHHPPAPLVVAATADQVESVVVCVDGSGHADTALETFASLPLAAATSVTVLAVDDGRSDPAAAVDTARESLSGRVKDVHTAVEKGRPTHHILGHLEDHRPQLVVLGTRGLTGWQRLRLGSTATAVVRAAPCTSLVACDEGFAGGGP